MRFLYSFVIMLPLALACGKPGALPPEISNPENGAVHFPAPPRSGQSLVLPGGAAPLVLCRYRSRAGNCFRLLQSGASAATGAIAVPMASEVSFRQFTSELSLLGDGMQICEVSERWGPWREVRAAASGLAPGKLEERYCSPGPVSDALACPCRSLRETRPARGLKFQR